MNETDMLNLSGVSAVYSNIVLALRGVSLSVPKGSIVALLGANGAGKTSTLKAISNLISLERGEVTEGTIMYDGSAVQGVEPGQLVCRGIVQVMEGRRCFVGLSVEENLSVAENNVRQSSYRLIKRVGEIYELFPSLGRQRKKRAGVLSGGEQQMLAIGRALLAQPKLLLLDEPSMGLAPQLVVQIFETLRELNESLGLTILVAEQNARVALKHAHFGYILSNGTVSRGGPAAELAQSEDVQKFYLGIGDKNAAARHHVASDIDWMT
jgi:branched-chain amino acid transport system ATP-binding protein